MKRKTPKAIITEIPDHENICLLTMMDKKMDFEDLIDHIERIDVLSVKCDTLLIDRYLLNAHDEYRFIKLSLDEYGIPIEDSEERFDPEQNTVTLADNIIKKYRP